MTISSSNIFPFAWGEHVQAWLEFLPHDSIHDWANLKRVFVGNFQGCPSVLGTPGTSRAASRSPVSPYGITSIGSPNDATPSLMSSTQM